MIVAGTPKQRKATLFGSRQSPVLSSPAKQGKPAGIAKSRICCRGINDCMSMGSIASTSKQQQQQQQQHQHQHQQHQSTSKLEEQIDDLKKEVQKQKELRIIYRKRMERTQDYLRYCLQIAQDNGLLELMTTNNEYHHQSLLSPNISSVIASPQVPTPLINDSTSPGLPTPFINASPRVPTPLINPGPLVSTPLINASPGLPTPLINPSPQVPTPLVNPSPPLPIPLLNASPQLPTPLHQRDLSVVTNQAKMNGWYINPNEIEFKGKIGQGSTADIYRAIWRGFDVAVKCIYPDFFQRNENGLAFFAQEVETLSRQRHRFVLQLMGACLEPPNHGWMVTEYLNMTLKEWLHGPGRQRRKERTVPLPPFEERLDRALEIAQAMQYLHEQKPKVIHRDLKPSNIFLDDAMHVRVADFGHARLLTDEEMALTGETGTYVYMAPEVIRCEPYNEKCDVYSFGIILNELITGDHPYIETDYGPTKIAMEVGEGKLRPALPENDDQLGEIIELICLSWHGDASIRPSFSSITCCLRKLHKKLIEIS